MAAEAVTGTKELLVAEQLYNTFDGTRIQFNDVTVTLCAGQKLGLVGVNGCGKSTMLKVLGGRDAPDRGTVRSPKGTKVVFVEQEPVFAPGATVLDVIYSADNPLMRAVRDYQEASEALTEDPSSAAAAAKFDAAMGAMETVGGWDADTFAQQVMSRLRVSSLQRQAVDALSGGERKRVALAAALIQKPDVLLLDEPTNHLDVEAIEWLEDLLADRSLTCLVVTHDRYFLENISNEILELEDGVLHRYAGSYDRFIEAKRERLLNENAALSAAQNKLRSETEWMRKQPRARQAKSKSREAAFFELKGRVDRGLDKDASKVELRTGTKRLGDTIISFKDACLAFDGKPMLDDFTYSFDKGDRVGIVGRNGVGKTTFLKVLTRLQALDTGVVMVGDTVAVGYYEQTGLGESVRPGMRVLQMVEDTCAGAEVAEGEDANPLVRARQLLGRFKFPASRWNDMVERLSGGERRRLQLLQVLAKNPNFLVLDEPSNDLDLSTLGVLEDFLINEYKGCLIVVSHDRWFMDKVAKHLFVFEGDGIVRDFEGSFSEYLDLRKAMQREVDTRAKKAPREAAPAPPPAPKVVTLVAAPATSRAIGSRRLTSQEKREYNTLEKDMGQLAKEKAAIEAKLATAHEDDVGFTEQAAWTTELSGVVEQIQQAEERWLELAELSGDF